MLDKRQDDEKYMRGLYEHFREEVLAGGSIGYYEKDELLDIYDYAQDEGDALVQMYVFMTTNRLYPDSRMLDERLGFFLSFISSEAGKDLLKRAGKKESALWDVLALSLKHFPDGDPTEDLTALLCKHGKLDCESVLKIIDLLRDMERIDLLVDNFSILHEKAEDKRGLIYEIAEVVKDDPVYMDSARQLAEELTKTEPFNADNWLLLAKIEFAQEHIEEALSAADYALAIDPESRNARLMKALILVPGKQTRKQAIAMLQDIIKEQPLNSIAVKALAEAYAAGNQNDLAVNVYARFMELDVANAFIILDILKLSPSDPQQYFDLFKKSVGGNERQWIDIAGQLDKSGCVEQAVQFLEYFHRHFELREGVEFYLRLLYRSHRFKEYISCFSGFCRKENEQNHVQYDLSLISYLLLASSYLLTRQFDEAIQITTLMLDSTPDIADIEDNLKLKGIQVTAQLIRTLAMSPERMPDNEYFDPVSFLIHSS